MNFLSRLFILKKIETYNGLFLYSKNVQISLGKNSKIIIRNGIFRVGYFIDMSNAFSPYSKTSIYLGENAILEINGDVNIGPGSSIIVNKNAHMIFGGGNAIAHNNLFYCYRKIEIGKNTCSSWNCQFMDSDGHVFYSSKNGGKKIEPFYKPLLIGENVGIQMNVIIPRGINVGHSAVISCGTILRDDVEPETLSYSDHQIITKKGIMSPYGKKLE